MDGAESRDDAFGRDGTGGRPFSGLDGDGNQLPPAGETACPTYFAKRLIQQDLKVGQAVSPAVLMATINGRHLKMNKFQCLGLHNPANRFTAKSRARPTRAVGAGHAGRSGPSPWLV